MNVFQKPALVALALATWATCALAQGGGSFDLSAYTAFLARNRDLTAEGFAGPFQDRSVASPGTTSFFPRVDSLFKLTPYEKNLLTNHGFVVTRSMMLLR